MPTTRGTTQHHLTIERDEGVLYNNCSDPRGRDGHRTLVSIRKGRDCSSCDRGGLAAGYSKIELADDLSSHDSDRE